MNKRSLDLNKVLGILKKLKPEFAAVYGVIEIGIFGSLARGESKPDSDVDVVVKMKTPDLFSIVHIKESLESEFLCPVDIVRFRDRMNPFLKARIEKEAVYV